MKIRNWLINGLALCAMSVPSVALEVYNNEESGAKVEVYGNIRGYAMGSTAMRSNDLTNNGGISGIGVTTNRNWNNGFNAGLQTNSRIGAKFTLGKFLGHIELGAQEPGLFGNAVTNGTYAGDIGFRLLYGQYDFGKGGKITFGKTNTPTVVTGFVNDVMATDNGAWGFGALPISVRKLQLQYSIFGATLALIEDNPGELTTIVNSTATTGNRRVSLMPRIALAYDYKGEKNEAKVGLSYRYINTLGTGNNAIHTTTNAKNSFHILAAGKFHFLNKKMYLSLMWHYGLNANEERMVAYLGGYSHTSIANTILTTTPNNPTNWHIVGGYLELGYSFTDKIGLRVGLGGQTALGINAQVTDAAVVGNGMLMANLPVKLNQYVTLTPQLGYYATAIATASNTANASEAILGGLAGILRAEFNF